MKSFAMQSNEFVFCHFHFKIETSDSLTLVNHDKISHNNFGYRKIVAVALALLNAACQNYHFTFKSRRLMSILSFHQQIQNDEH